MHGFFQMVDNTPRKVPIARIEIDTPYLSGTVEALCPPNAIYDLIVGNVPRARAADDPDLQWQLDGVTTRAMAKKEGEMTPLEVPGGKQRFTVNKEILKKAQAEDGTIQKYRQLDQPKIKGNQEVRFEIRNDILYRIYKHPKVERGEPVRQIVVPRSSRPQVMELAHESMFSGHMRVRKTVDRILSNFYWPGVRSDVAKFCNSCPICKRTVGKGRVARAPLQNMPKIDMPFRRVAVDLIGPIYPPSKSGRAPLCVDFSRLCYSLSGSRTPEANQY